MTHPDICLVAAPMGGAWAVPETEQGRDIGRATLGEAAYPLAPLGGRDGWILEPADAFDGISALLEAGASVVDCSGRLARLP